MSSRWLRSALVAAAAVLLTVAVGRPVHAGLPGASSTLTRAPYLTDLTAGSIRVNWATTTQTRGVVKYGPLGDCTANSVQSPTLGLPMTINGVRQYQNSVALTGLQAGTTYCYRVYTGDSAAIDLLGSNPSPQFTTLSAPGSTEPFSFVVFSDSGDTTNSSGDNDGSLNQNQASVHAQIAASGARFAIATGDIVHPSGTPTNYGDLNQTGPDVSAFFGPQYWAVPGQSVPLYVAMGNHGRNATFLSTFPQTTVAAESGGVNGMVSYPSYFGSDPGDFAATYYAFSMGGVRFYVLQAAWNDSNVGNADGGACGKYCKKYQLDYAAHWTVDSAQYQWLAADLAAHPGGLKFAFFHFPLRSDDKSQPSSVYLQNTPGSTGSLEELLRTHGVNLVFNGHSHTYQRFVAPPGGVPSYVLGGGGGRLVSVGNAPGGCSPMNAYALGWSYSSGGSSCGAASKPTSPAQVHHFVKVTVDGTTVTVTPINALGQAFDVVTYDFTPDAVAPSAPRNLTATRVTGSNRVNLNWTGATDNIGVAAYDIYRNGVWLATRPGTARAYVDTSADSGASYLYEVRARDLAGNATGATAAVGNPDSEPPSVPTNVQAQATGPTSVSISWDASSDNVGVTGYTVRRDGQPVATTSDTSYVDTGLTPGTTYQYTVSAADAAGNTSPASQPATATTAADTTPPSAPSGLTAAGVTASSVTLSWTASTDDVGVVRYEVLRDGVLVGSSPSTSFVDTTVAPETTYSYVVRAVDAGDNTASSDALSVTTPAAGVLFGDGFESGGLGQWETVSGLVVQSAVVRSGGFAVRQTSSGSATYAYKHLPGTYDELWISGWVYIASHSTSVNLFGFRSSSGGSIVNVYVDSRGLLSLRNNAGGVTTYSTTVVPVGSWHYVVLHAVVNGSSSSLDVTFDGVAVPELALTGQNLGTKPIARVQLGETSTGRTYDVIIDDLLVSTTPVDASGGGGTPPGDPPSDPPGEPSGLFGDGFESGGLGQWETVSGLVVQSAVVRSGGFAVRQTSSGSATYAYKHLPGTYDELWISGWVYIASHSTSVNLFGFRSSSGGSIVNVYVDSRGLLSLRNNAGGVTTYSTTVVPVGSWHYVVLHAVVNGSSSSLDVTFDGVAVPELALTGQNLGTKPIARVQLGETSTGRTYDVIIDDLLVSTTPVDASGGGGTPPGDPPSDPPGEPSGLFGDGFESGGLGQWETVSGLVVQSAVVRSGGFAVRQTSSGSATYAYKHLPGTYDELWISGWVYIASHSTSVNLFGFRSSSGGSIVNVYVDSRGLLSLRNNAGGVTTYSTTVVPVGSWHYVVLHAVVNGSSSSLDVTFDGVAVPELALTGQNLGTKPIARVQLGETSTGRTYDVIIDDLLVSTTPLA